MVVIISTRRAYGSGSAGVPLPPQGILLAALLACVVLLAAAGYGQAAFAQPHIVSAHHWVSDGAVDVQLDGPISWVNAQGIRTVGSNGWASVTGRVFHSGDNTPIALYDVRGGGRL